MTPIRTAWKVSLALLIVIIVVALTSRFWTVQIGRSLVCAEDLAPSNAILVENFDPNYLLFERAAALEKAGVAPTTLVPVGISSDAESANPVSTGIAELMARQARLRSWRMIPFRTIEPISLNAALQIRARLTAERITSVVVVSPGFRSRRSTLVYRATLGAAGIAAHCVPVFGRTSPENWTRTWHGIQEVAEEFLKLQYYRFYVLPFVAPGAATVR
jgi:hypothetical protein